MGARSPLSPSKQLRTKKQISIAKENADLGKEGNKFLK
jgi:hypothetical protein